VLVSCVLSPRQGSPSRAADAGDERPIRPAGQTATAPGHIVILELNTPDAHAAGEPRRTVASLSVRHGWLRRNAVSPHGVRLSGAPGAPLRIGCWSENRALAGKFPRDGIVVVPRVFDAGCSAILPDEVRGQPDKSARTGDQGERCCRPCAPRSIYLAFGHLAAHGGTRGDATSAPRGAAIPGEGPSGFTQAAENHGRTISERHNRTPHRRVRRV
jgi:hypothetical protein